MGQLPTASAAVASDRSTPSRVLDPTLELFASRQFADWLADERLGLAFTTYRSDRLFLIGVQANGRLSFFERRFERAMGLWVSSDSRILLLSSLYQVWRFHDALGAGDPAYRGYQQVYVPQVAWTTGDLDVHDLALDAAGRLVFVNTLYGCLATVSETNSFVPLWRPPWLTKLAAEDRCHLNGLAIRDGRPAYVTAVSRSDAADGWRDRRMRGGVAVDVATDEVVLEGLSMPHSPRWHDPGDGQGGRLWLADSGTGYFGYADLERGRFEPVTFCPGYARGLAFHGYFAVVGLSKPRRERTFAGLGLDDQLAARDVEPRCGLLVIDLRTGDVVHWLRIEGPIEELYDVATLPGVRRPMALGLKTDEIRRVITVGEPQSLFASSYE